MIITHPNLLQFFQLCAEQKLGDFNQVIVPRQSMANEENLHYAPYTKDIDPVLTMYRAVEPIRMLFYFPRDKVVPNPPKTPKRIIAGVKACDLSALALLDTALIDGDFTDPAYKAWRDNTYIISTDCTDITPSCHCNLLDGQPWPEKGFDLNLSKVDGGYVIQTGSKKGEELLALMKDKKLVTDKKAGLNKQVADIRHKVVEKLTAQNHEFERPGKYENLRRAEPEFWQEASKDCVGCGACTNSCPTCYCMILNDETTGKTFQKVRSQDSCQLNGYAKVAGGDTPRPKMTSRFRNRYLCKFNFMKSNFDRFGCVGCGRCSIACAGEIDWRKVTKEAIESVKS